MQDSKIVPEARLDDVRAALKAAFGTRNVGALQPLRGGVSGALILRFGVRKREYVLRIEPERIALQDRQRGFSCMTAAATVGAAPAVLGSGLIETRDSRVLKVTCECYCEIACAASDVQDRRGGLDLRERDELGSQLPAHRPIICSYASGSFAA
jgi:hypothetical protein